VSKKKEKKKGMSNLKKMICKIAKNEKNPDQGDNEDALHPIHQQQNLHPKKKQKMGGRKRKSDFKKKSIKDSK